MTVKDFFFLLVRLFLGYIFLSSGLCKLTHGEFGQLIGPPLLIEQLKAYDLALFGYIIATSQVLVGALVMSQRFSLLGLIGLVPINFCILAVTLSQNWTGTPYVNAFLLLLNLIALLYEYHSLKVLFLNQALEKAKVPLSIQFFPNPNYAFIQLVLITLAIVFSFFNLGLLLIVANLYFLLVFISLFSQSAFQVFQKLVLACFLLFVLSLSNGKILMEWGFNMQWMLIVPFLIGFLSWLASMIWRKPTRSLQMQN